MSASTSEVALCYVLGWPCEVNPCQAGEGNRRILTKDSRSRSADPGLSLHGLVRVNSFFFPEKRGEEEDNRAPDFMDDQPVQLMNSELHITGVMSVTPCLFAYPTLTTPSTPRFSRLWVYLLCVTRTVLYASQRIWSFIRVSGRHSPSCSM